MKEEHRLRQKRETLQEWLASNLGWLGLLVEDERVLKGVVLKGMVSLHREGGG